MNTKQYLRQLWDIDDRISDKLDEVRKWEDMAIGLGSPVCDENKVQTSRKLDTMCTAMAHLVDAKEEYEKKLVELTDLKKTIVGQIDSMQGNDYKVLSDSYIKHLSPQEIAWERKIGLTTAKRYLKTAHENFENLYGSTYLLK